MLIKDPIISLLPLNGNSVRKNNINLYYSILKNASFIIIPVIGFKSGLLNNLKMLLRKNNIQSLFLKLSFPFIKPFLLTNQNLLIIINGNYLFSFISIKLLLINLGFNLYLCNCYLYSDSYYLNYSLVDIIDNIDYLNEISINFSLLNTFYNIVFSFFSVLLSPYEYLNNILLTKI